MHEHTHRWPTAAKSAVGTAINPGSRVWFTAVDGNISEVFFSGPDQVCVRELRFAISLGDGGFIGESHLTHSWAWKSPGVPAFTITSSSPEFQFEKTIFTDPVRDSLVIRGRVIVPGGSLKKAKIRCLLFPYVSKHAKDDKGWVEFANDREVFITSAPPRAVALACDAPWSYRAVDRVENLGSLDHIAFEMATNLPEKRTCGGPLVFLGDFEAESGAFEMALGFGACPAAASLQARCSLQDGWERGLSIYVKGWSAWQSTLQDLSAETTDGGNLFRSSAAVLKIHHGKDFPGAAVASLSNPWSEAKADPNQAAYHFLWIRDLAEIAGALLAIGDHESARKALIYIAGVQNADGHWAQNMWLDGTTHWKGIQMDETALPILLLEFAHREGALEDRDLRKYWPMTRKAADYLIKNGPGSEEDRWEQTPGFSTATMASAVASLIAAAHLAEIAKEDEVAALYRATADRWNLQIDQLNFVSGTRLATECGVEGYYLWIRPFADSTSGEPLNPWIHLAHYPKGAEQKPASEIVSPDALALVRFGLRSAADPRIRSTIKVIDHVLRRETSNGPAWRRYSGDAYGEKEDGSPFSGSGVGRAWPLLTGERAHYEIAAGNIEGARALAETIRKFSDNGLIPEQVWDGPDLPQKGLRNGGATHSSRPLVWAHAEYLKLLRSLRDRRVFDTPSAKERYC